MPAKARQAVFALWPARVCMVSYEIIQIENCGADGGEKNFSAISHLNTYTDCI
jgi:hypothetical protein